VARSRRKALIHLPSKVPPDEGRLCGIVLAGGEGTRLRHFIQRRHGKPLPKQFVNFVGRRSMLEHTFDRAERLISADRLYTVISRDHLDYPEVRRQIAGRSPGTVVHQPSNRDTGPGLLLPLIRLCRRHPHPLVAVFPSDHYVLEEDLFMHYVSEACRAVRREPSLVLLLGMEPAAPETEYGYVLPSEEREFLFWPGIRKVARFIEKPAENVARELIQSGGLWNSFVMAFNAETMLELVRRHAPALLQAFDPIWEAAGEAEERRILDGIYRDIEPLNFSRDLLEIISLREPSRLHVLPVRGVTWSDWGSERRVLQYTSPRARFPDETVGLESLLAKH
jgi:mannose-1-phosphate guanylyltransferase